jgi:hypothetical protein
MTVFPDLIGLPPFPHNPNAEGASSEVVNWLTPFGRTGNRIGADVTYDATYRHSSCNKILYKGGGMFLKVRQNLKTFQKD